MGLDAAALAGYLSGDDPTGTASDTPGGGTTPTRTDTPEGDRPGAV